jgi:hypothetical protein
VNTANNIRSCEESGKLNEMITKAVSEWEQKLRYRSGTQGNWQDPNWI